MGDNSDSGGDRCYQITAHTPNPETRYLQTEEQRILRTAIQRLGPNLRVVVQIHLQGRSMPETAEASGISLAAAKGRLFHARRALRRLVLRKLGRPGDGRARRPLAINGIQGRVTFDGS
jgi:DNA-directed RNA polymerase specialized sigma24 family protein